MLKPLITSLLMLSTCAANAQKCKHPIKLVVIGSSTSAGTGASKPDSAYVSKLRKFMIDSVNVGCTVENLAVGGATTYKMQPDWYTPPAVRSSFTVDKAKNIDKAISLNPDGIIINYPSNDAANNFALQEQQDNFMRVKAKADSAGIPVWVTTTQPRNFANASQKQLQTDMRDWINTTFGQKAIDFWTTIADLNGDIATAYNSGDNVHLNDAGHALLFQRVKQEGIHVTLCDTPLSIPKQEVHDIAVYPNPVNDALYLKTGMKDGSCEYELTDLFGKTVQEGRVYISAGKGKIGTQNLPVGTYLLELASGETRATKLILKE